LVLMLDTYSMLAEVIPLRMPVLIRDVVEAAALRY